MLKYKTIVAAVLATAAFAVHAEIPQDVEGGPQPAPYGITDPVLAPAAVKVAVFNQDVEGGPQPAPYGITNPAPTPAGLKVAVFPQDVEGGPQRVN